MRKDEIVREYIKEKIASGVFKVGSRIPTEEELIATLQISRTPIRKALKELCEDGYIYKIQGSGSFVRNKAIPEPVNIYAVLHTEDSFLESRIILGMRRAIDDSSYRNIHLILQKPGKNTVKQIEVLNMIPCTGKGAVICVPMVDEVRAGNRLLGANLRKIEKAGFPVLLLDKSLPEYTGSSVMTDHRGGAEAMQSFLWEHGHRNTAVLYSHQNVSSVGLRLQGIREFYREREKENGRLLPVNVDQEPVSPEMIRKLAGSGYTALFCLECEIAKQVYLAAGEADLKIPGDFSLCSFDDHCFHDLKGDFLTAVSQRLENIGYYSVQVVLDKIEGKTWGNVNILVESDIVSRKSVASV